MQIRNQRDFWAGVLFIVTGLIFMVLSRQYNVGTSAKMGPGYFPMMLGGLMAVLGVMVVIPSVLKSAEVLKITKIEPRMVLLVLVAVAVYAFALPKLGFIVALFALIVISSIASHEFNLKTTLISSVILLVFSWLVFVKGLELQFPFLPTFLTNN
jgi:hypothetical protein